MHTLCAANHNFIFVNLILSHARQKLYQTLGKYNASTHTHTQNWCQFFVVVDDVATMQHTFLTRWLNFVWTVCIQPVCLQYDAVYMRGLNIYDNFASMHIFWGEKIKQKNYSITVASNNLQWMKLTFIIKTITINNPWIYVFISARKTAVLSEQWTQPIWKTHAQSVLDYQNHFCLFFAVKATICWFIFQPILFSLKHSNSRILCSLCFYTKRPEKNISVNVWWCYYKINTPWTACFEMMTNICILQPDNQINSHENLKKKKNGKKQLEHDEQTVSRLRCNVIITLHKLYLLNESTEYR